MEPVRATTLYLLCGRIAAGKSTLARRLAARPGTLLISQDHWMSNLFSDDELKTIDDFARLSARLRAAMAPHVVDILRQGLSVVLDFPANTVTYRNWIAVVDYSSWRGPRASSARCSGHDLQAAASATKCGWRAPLPGQRGDIRSVHELFRPSGTRRGLQRRRSCTLTRSRSGLPGISAF